MSIGELGAPGESLGLLAVLATGHQAEAGVLVELRCRGEGRRPVGRRRRGREIRLRRRAPCIDATHAGVQCCLALRKAPSAITIMQAMVTPEASAAGRKARMSNALPSPRPGTS